MKKPIVLLLCIIITFGNIAYAENTSVNDLKIGDYIQFGQYRGAPIIWRYAADDENGRLIVSDKILCLKDFNINNYWNDSYIRLWLNSKAPRYRVKIVEGISKRPIYNFEAGFLADERFTPQDRAAIKQICQKTLLDLYSLDFAEGGEFEYWNTHNTQQVKEFVDNCYDLASYDYSIDLMFLPDILQFNNMLQNIDILGEDFIFSSPTPQVFDPALTNYEDSTEETSFSYLLRTPYAFEETRYTSPHTNTYYRCGALQFEVSKNTIPDKGKNIQNYVSRTSVGFYNGIRPAFYLNDNNTQILSGNGTECSPYIITGINVSEDGNDGAFEGIDSTDYKQPFYVLLFVNNKSYLLAEPKYCFYDSYYESPYSLPYEAPFLENGSIFIPITMLPDAFNINYKCNNEMLPYKLDIDNLENNYFEPGIARLFNDNYDFFVQCDSNIITTNDGKEILLDVAPKLKFGTIFLPIRALTELLGGTLEWYDDADGQRILVSLP